MSATWSKGIQDTVNSVLNRAVKSYPDRVFLEFSGQTYTYADIDRGATRLGHGLADRGVKHGQTVAWLLDSSAESIFTMFGIMKLGAVSVPVNTAYKGEFLRHQLADAGAEVIIAESDYAERVLEIARDLPEVRLLVYRGALSSGAAPAGLEIIPLDALYAGTAEPIADEVSYRDLAMLIYTAGTTGPSKGCMISHAYACHNARMSILTSGRTSEDISWTALPLFHFNAISVTVLATALLAGRASIYPRFSLSNFWPEIERTKATYATALGSMVPLIAQAPDNEASKRCYGRLKVVGGAPFPLYLQEKWKERFGVTRCGSNAFGLTESSLLTSLPASEEPAPNSSGRRNEFYDVRIVDDEDQELAAGTPGEVICRPRQPGVMFDGYWRRPAETQKAMRNLWFHTGDIGKIDEDGFFYFLDRKKDYLRRRGENISSFEMETTFRAHEAIEDVVVHAVPSPVGEDDVKVTAVLKAGMTLTEEDLCTWAIERLPYFAVPRYIEFRAILPRNPVGRVLKYQLRDEGCTDTTWDREKSSLELKKR
jgi:carnitine-CoA ligase